MDFKSLSDKAKKALDERGGMESVKQEARRLKDIAQGEGTIGEKAQRAMQEVSDTNAAQRRPPTSHADEHPPVPDPQAPAAAATGTPPPSAAPNPTTPGVRPDPDAPPGDVPLGGQQHPPTDERA